MKYDSLPKSIQGQIADGDTYDLYGKIGFAFEDSEIDAPIGSAADDYTTWLQLNPDIAQEVHETILRNAKAINPDVELSSDEAGKYTWIITEFPEPGHEQPQVDEVELPKPKDPSVPAPGQTPNVTEKDKKKLTFKDVLEYKEEDWVSGGSAQADRDAAVLGIFDILKSNEMTSMYKVGAVMVSCMQYFYKRRQNSDQLKVIENSEVGEAIKQGLKERFEEQNRIMLQKFYENLESQTKHLGIMIQTSFSELFEERKR